MSDPWEKLRHMTLDQLVTAVKLRGSAGSINGTTTPEGWQFRILVAIGSPGNERAVQLADDLNAQLAEIASFTARVDRSPT